MLSNQNRNLNFFHHTSLSCKCPVVLRLERELWKSAMQITSFCLFTYGAPVVILFRKWILFIRGRKGRVAASCCSKTHVNCNHVWREISSAERDFRPFRWINIRGNNQHRHQQHVPSSIPFCFSFAFVERWERRLWLEQRSSSSAVVRRSRETRGLDETSARDNKKMIRPPVTDADFSSYHMIFYL